MTTNQDLRCQVETDISRAVVCFGNELKTGARSTAEFLDAAVSLGFASVELCDRSVRDPAAVQAGLRDRGLAMPSIALRNDFRRSGLGRRQRRPPDRVADHCGLA